MRTKLQRAIGAGYKLVGFAVLATILLGLASFVFTNLFYAVSTRWITPMTVSPTDPRVLALNALRAADSAARDQLATQRLQLEAQLADARRVQASEERFQAAFQAAFAAEATDRGGELASLQQLLADLTATREEVARTSEAYTAVSKDALAEEKAAGLIDAEQATRGGYELSQIAGADLALRAKHVELDARIAELSRAVASLRGGGASTFEVLHMRHELDASVLASRRAAGEADALAKSVALLDGVIADYDAQLARIARAPYVQAADRSVTTAFVPYDNLAAAKAGAPVFQCVVSVIACSKVGTVAEVLEGEVTGKHPLHGRELRGVLVRLTLDDPTAVRRPVLHVGGKPLGV